MFLYKKNNGDDVYSDVNIIAVDKLIKASDDELKKQYDSQDLKILTNKLVSYYAKNKDNKVVLLYRGAVGKY